jgi:hypothetical protein
MLHDKIIYCLSNSYYFSYLVLFAQSERTMGRSAYSIVSSSDCWRDLNGVRCLCYFSKPLREICFGTYRCNINPMPHNLALWSCEAETQQIKFIHLFHFTPFIIIIIIIIIIVSSSSSSSSKPHVTLSYSMWFTSLWWRVVSCFRDRAWVVLRLSPDVRWATRLGLREMEIVTTTAVTCGLRNSSLVSSRWNSFTFPFWFSGFSFLNASYLDRCIRRGRLQAWPPGSPDLSPTYFFLWGHVKM